MLFDECEDFSGIDAGEISDDEEEVVVAFVVQPCWERSFTPDGDRNWQQFLQQRGWSPREIGRDELGEHGVRLYGRDGCATEVHTAFVVQVPEDQTLVLRSLGNKYCWDACHALVGVETIDAAEAVMTHKQLERHRNPHVARMPMPIGWRERTNPARARTPTVPAHPLRSGLASVALVSSLFLGFLLT